MQIATLSPGGLNVKISPTPSLVTLTFVILKLTHQIDWSWWWVLVPSWGIMVITAALTAYVSLRDAIDRRRERRAATHLERVSASEWGKSSYPGAKDGPTDLPLI